MKGWKLYRHAVMQVAGNFGPALRISALLVLPVALCVYLLDTRLLLARYLVMQIAFGGGVFPAGAVLIPWGVATAFGLWIGIAWHRFVLLGERPRGLLPPLPRSGVGAFLSAFAGVAVFGGVASAALGFGVGLVWGGVALAFGLADRAVPAPVLLVIGLVSLIWWLRWSVCVPSAAVGRDLGPMEAWRQTGGSSWPILISLLLLAMTIAVLTVPLSRWIDPLGGAGLIYGQLVGWVAAMLLLSLQTTLYGHYVENRPLV